MDIFRDHKRPQFWRSRIPVSVSNDFRNWNTCPRTKELKYGHFSLGVTVRLQKLIKKRKPYDLVEAIFEYNSDADVERPKENLPTHAGQVVAISRSEPREFRFRIENTVASPKSSPPFLHKHFAFFHVEVSVLLQKASASVRLTTLPFVCTRTRKNPAPFVPSFAVASNCGRPSQKNRLLVNLCFART